MRKRLDTSGITLGGRITIFDDPSPERHYAIGLDFALGIQGTGDYDAGVMFDDLGVQVATIHGRWGPEVFGKHLRPLLDWYNPLICGEQQFGLAVLRQLYKWGYWMYYDRDEKKRGRPMTDKLGHFKTHTHMPIMTLRQALYPFNEDGSPRTPDCVLKDAELVAQLSSFQYITPTGAELQDTRDVHLSMGAPKGYFDDLVNAAGYGLMALRDMPHFPKPEKKFAPNSMAELLGVANDLLGIPQQPENAIAWGPPKR